MNVNTVLKYDDNRQDLAGGLTDLLGEDDDPGEGAAPVPSAPRPKPKGGPRAAPARPRPASLAPAVVAEAPVDPASFAPYVPPGASDQLAELKRLRSKGWTLERLADRYGVGCAAIREGLAGKGWSYAAAKAGGVAG